MERQQGAVLIVALLILLVMTIVGISAMKTTTLDERIAANTQFKTTTFQAAESAIAEASIFEKVEECLKGDCRNGVTVVDREFSTVSPDEAADEVERNVTASAQMFDRGEIPLTGSSLGVGGGAVVVLRVFDVTGESEFEGTSAESLHHQRVGRVAPHSGQ